jgi:quercetin dioxygenase-like cupin family protein
MATDVTEIMEATQPIAFARGRQSLDQSVWYNGWLVTFLTTGQDTQGQFALTEQVSRQGHVPPPHIHHREDELFYVLEGEMTFSVGDRTIKATPGTLAFVPRGVVHSFALDSELVRMLVMFTPAGFEGFFKECSVPAPSMTLPPPAEMSDSERQNMMAVAPKYGTEFVLPKR